MSRYQKKPTRLTFKDQQDTTAPSSNDNDTTAIQNASRNYDANANIEIQNVETTSHEEVVITTEISTTVVNTLTENYGKEIQQESLIASHASAICENTIPKDFVEELEKGTVTEETCKTKGDVTKHPREMLFDNEPVSKKQKADVSESPEQTFADAATSISSENEQELYLVESGDELSIQSVKVSAMGGDTTLPSEYKHNLLDVVSSDDANEATYKQEKVSENLYTGGKTPGSQNEKDLELPNEDMPIKPPRNKNKTPQYKTKVSGSLVNEPEVDKSEAIKASFQATGSDITIPHDYTKELEESKETESPVCEIESNDNEKMSVGATITGQNTTPDKYKAELNKTPPEEQLVDEKIIPSHTDVIGITTIPNKYRYEVNMTLSNTKTGYRDSPNITMFESSSEEDAIDQKLKDESTENFEVVEDTACTDQAAQRNTLSDDNKNELEKSLEITSEQYATNDYVMVGEEIIPTEANTMGGITIPSIYIEEINKPNMLKDFENDEEGPVTTDEVIIPSQTEAIGKTTIPSKYRQELNSPSPSDEAEFDENIPSVEKSSVNTKNSETKNVSSSDSSLPYRSIGVGLVLVTSVILAILYKKRF